MNKTHQTQNEIIYMVIFAIITSTIVLLKKDMRKKVTALASNTSFLLGCVPVIGLSWWSLSLPNNSKEALRLKSATKQAIIGLLIAIFAHLDLKVAPFYLIWFVSYYLNI